MFLTSTRASMKMSCNCGLRTLGLRRTRSSACTLMVSFTSNWLGKVWGNGGSGWGGSSGWGGAAICLGLPATAGRPLTTTIHEEDCCRSRIFEISTSSGIQTQFKPMQVAFHIRMFSAHVPLPNL